MDEKNIEKMIWKFDKYLKQLSEPYKTICEDVVCGELFQTSYASAGKHHSYPGGLAVHTLEVLEGALAMAKAYPNADKEVIIVSAIFHDYMKIREYEPSVSGSGKYEDGTQVKIGKTPYRNLIRHVAGSHAEFVCTIRDYEYDYGDKPEWQEKNMKIQHCILSHHGRQECGSPIEPQIVEAHILHFADMLSSRYGKIVND